MFCLLARRNLPSFCATNQALMGVKTRKTKEKSLFVTVYKSVPQQVLENFRSLPENLKGDPPGITPKRAVRRNRAVHRPAHHVVHRPTNWAVHRPANRQRKNQYRGGGRFGPLQNTWCPCKLSCAGLTRASMMSVHINNLTAEIVAKPHGLPGQARA